MAPAPIYGRNGYQPGSPRERAFSTALSVGVILLALLLALLQTQIAPKPEQRQPTTTFDISPERGGDKAAEKRKSRAAPKPPQPRTRQHTTPPRPPTPRPVEQPVVKDPLDPAFIHLSRRDFAAADIGGMRASGADGAKGEEGRQAAYGPGEGPGGMQLYNADWYRKPTDAQLSGYLPKDAPSEGWGLVACRTVENYRVEDCRILGESPRGSGFGRAVQDAAWQFQVLPPRINSKPQIGAWVRIRIDYRQGISMAG